MLNVQGIKVRSRGQKRRKALRRNFEEDFEQHQTKRARRKRVRERDKERRKKYATKIRAMFKERKGQTWIEMLSSFVADKIWKKQDKKKKPDNIVIKPGKENHGRPERSTVNRTPDKRP
jgi:hypothetical protein